jgi:hypothetical protein
MKEELSECCPEEYDLAAQVVCSGEEGLLALCTIHATLCDASLRHSSRRFNPLKEYANVAVVGGQDEILSQQKLMTVADGIDFPGESICMH